MEAIGLLIQLLAVFGLLVIGGVAGRIAERRHYARIRGREKATIGIPVVAVEKAIDSSRAVSSSSLAVGSVVVSVDYFKRFLGALRMLFGGELGAYSPLLDRGRREALLRMKESHPAADAFLNVRLETASLSKGERKGLGSVEVVAYGTAITYAPIENALRSEGA